MELKKPISYKDQVNRLKEENMIVESESEAEAFLEKVSYYRFSGYAIQFRTQKNISYYVEGTSFNKTVKIIEWDNRIRSLLRKYIESAEIYYRCRIAHIFSMKRCCDAPHDQHYDDVNFENKETYRYVKDHFKKERGYYKSSLIIKHHEAKYDNKLPLWAIMELMSFSDMSRLYSAMLYEDRQDIANYEGISENTLVNHLHCLSVLRNKCAHAVRLYNTPFSPPARLSASALRKYPEIKNDSMFAYILVLIKRLPTREMKEQFVEEVISVTEQYIEFLDKEIICFPDKYEQIMKNSI